MRVGPWGLLQPLADGVKLLLKEDIIPIKADRRRVYHRSNRLRGCRACCVGGGPLGPDVGDYRQRQYRTFVYSRGVIGGVLGLVLAGWGSNSKYSLLGALRSSAQMVSYEIGMGLSLIGALMFAKTLSMSGIIDAQRADGMWYIFFQPLGFLVTQSARWARPTVLRLIFRKPSRSWLPVITPSIRGSGGRFSSWRSTPG